jgi:hypothetical protein
MKKLVLFAMTFAAVLPLVAARPAHAAAQVNVVAQAVGDKDPFALSWLDDTNGNTKTDQTMSQKIHDTFANVQYVITDTHQLLLAQGTGGNLKTILPPVNALDVSNGQGDYVVHLRAQSTFLDGVVYQFSDEPGQGLARLTLTLLDSKGNSASTYIEQGLTFATSQPSPTPQPTPNPFGF